MPCSKDVERHYSEALAGERLLGDRRIEREEFRARQASDAAAVQVASAAAQAKETVLAARAEAEAMVQRAKCRLSQERQRCDIELAAAEEHAQEAMQAAAARVRAAEGARDAAKLDAEKIVERAAEASRVAREAAEKQAAEAEVLAQQRREDASQREAAANARASRAEEEALERERRHLEELEKNLQSMEQMAQQRLQYVDQTAVDGIERCLHQLRSWELHVEQEFACTQRRVSVELRKSDILVAGKHSLAKDMSARGREAARLAENTVSASRHMADQAQRQHGQWCTSALETSAQQLEVFRDLEELATRLRSNDFRRELTMPVDLQPSVA